MQMVYLVVMIVEIPSEDAMKQFGEKIGGLLIGGECIELVGDVGSGKTTLTKGVAKGLGITETVQSPTFTINRTYDNEKKIRLSHYDFYRLNDPGIMADELQESLEDTKTIVIIEWGDIVESVVPAGRLRITFSSPSVNERHLEITGTGEQAIRLMKGLA